MYDYLWALWDILWEFENFEMYVEYLEDTSLEFDDAITITAPGFLDIINTGL